MNIITNTHENAISALLYGGRKRTMYSDCPSCGYKGALAGTIKNGRQLFYCHAGCDNSTLMLTIRGYAPRAAVRQCDAPKNTGSADYAKKLWGTAANANGTVVERYLHSRGLTDSVPTCLRFLSSHPHKPSGRNFPVMLASVCDVLGELKAVHRTYLAPDGSGKAPVEPAKMTLGTVGGFGIHLAPAAPKMAITEGIETGLSVMQGTGIATWVAISAGGMKQLILPLLPMASDIVIAADADPAGMKAATAAAHRWQREGRQVRLAMPPAGTDFNDVLRGAL